jgi:hypothetical protein
MRRAVTAPPPAEEERTTMLWRARELLGHAISGTDGALGWIHDVYFDDQHWMVRYLAAETGHWLGGRRVLLSPMSVRRIDRVHRWAEVALTRQQVRDSPNVDTHKPVERQHEVALLEYYGVPSYWADHRPSGEAAAGAGPDDRHLHSARVVIGYAVDAVDGEVGYVEDFVVDDLTWTIRYLVLDSRHWWPGRRALLAPEWVGWVSWREFNVHVDFDRDTIHRAPEFDPARPIDRAYEARLHGHYGRPPHSSPGNRAA